MIMKYNTPRSLLFGCCGIVACWLLTATEIAAQDAVQRLLQRVEKIPDHLTSDESCQVPSLMREPTPVRQMGYRARRCRPTAWR